MIHLLGGDDVDVGRVTDDFALVHCGVFFPQRRGFVDQSASRVLKGRFSGASVVRMESG